METEEMARADYDPVLFNQPQFLVDTSQDDAFEPNSGKITWSTIFT